jgi:hypothetical protein
LAIPSVLLMFSGAHMFRDMSPLPGGPPNWIMLLLGSFTVPTH